MKRIFGILVILAIAGGGHAQTVHSDELAYASTTRGNSDSETGINIYPTVVSNVLNIEIGEKLAGGSVTVSVFNSIGEIVLENTLGIGLNKVYVESLAKGEYTAVVRENGVYASKSSFEVK